MDMGSLSNVYRGNNRTLRYALPQYREQSAELRRSTGRDYARSAQQLRAAGVPEADIPRMMTDQTIGAQQQQSSIYNRALDTEQQMREAKKAQRKSRLGRILGMAIDIPSRIGQYRLLSRSMSGGSQGQSTTQPQYTHLDRHQPGSAFQPYGAHKPYYSGQGR